MIHYPETDTFSLTYETFYCHSEHPAEIILDLLFYLRQSESPVDLEYLETGVKIVTPTRSLTIDVPSFDSSWKIYYDIAIRNFAKLKSLMPKK